MHAALCWSARLVALAAIAFISLFALDVLEPGAPPATVLIGLAVHLVPSAVLVAFLVVAWRWPLAGGVLFLAVSVLPVLILANTPAVNAILAMPFALAGLLFLACAFTAARHG